MKKSYLPLVLALSASTSGCFLGNQAKVKVPSPPPSGAPATTQPPPVSSTPAPSEGAETAPENPPAPAAASEPGSTPAPVPVPAPKPPVARINPPASTPAAPQTAPPSPPAPSVSPMPQLAEILTPEQRRQYQAEYAQDVARSDAALKRVSGHNLSAAQRETVARIRTFLSQAQAARYNDIATAVQLSRRADLLGQELLKGLK